MCMASKGTNCRNTDGVGNAKIVIFMIVSGFADINSPSHLIKSRLADKEHEVTSRLQTIPL